VTYTSLCRPILDLGWDPATRSKVPNIELVTKLYHMVHKQSEGS